ncbi:hypothetical protein DIURU_003588 [Diutina rugosa]|uniref:Midasin n=1 Tax=Diutina rugosa TaxID=5481 RepID=A0A642ULJ6_DIURU|nr:uncharacterized protein DIURU_003588 [Diutina rugosa]KAA8901218.1 hypothetical protein DIURU_003588 [Diutina rugosa]
MDDIGVDASAAATALSRYNQRFGTAVAVAGLTLDHLTEAMAHHPMAVAYAYPTVALDLVARLVHQQHPRALAVVGELAAVVSPVMSLAQWWLQQHGAGDDVVALYRLLSADRQRFAAYVDAPRLSALLNDADTPLPTKYIAALVMAQWLQKSDAAARALVSQYVGEAADVVGPWDGHNDVHYQFIPLIEAKRIATYKNLPAVTTEKASVTITPSELSPLVTSVCGVLVPQITPKSASTTVDEEPFVATEGAVAALRSLATHIQHNRPVLVHGPAGSGKTFMVHQLARYMGFSGEIVKIHLGEQTDSKLLLGTYTSGDTPGTFVWRAGVLTTAVTEGKWVVIEDIDHAPTEVLSVLLTLLEKRQLTLASRGDTINAAPGFQLLATVRSDNDEEVPDLIGINRWTPVGLGVPSAREIRQILGARFPRLSPQLVDKFVRCYHQVADIYRQPRFVSLNNGSVPRIVSFRDAVKLCQRCHYHLEQRNLEGNQPLPSEVFDDFFAEAVDCLASALADPRAVVPVVSVIGQCLEVPESRIELYLAKHVPRFVDSSSEVRIGRALLHKGPKFRHNQQKQTFAATNHALRLMEQIAVAVQMVEPVLLVGETGTGKTTVVQQVAQLLNQKLTVINVSQQTEVSDLLGGFKPVNTRLVAVPLQQRFDELFAATFSQKKNERFATVLAKQVAKGNWKNVVRLWHEAVKMAESVLSPEEPAAKKRKLDVNQRAELVKQWADLDTQVTSFELQALQLDSSFVFSFVEGSLVKAVRQGEWLLLDELNLASPDTLEAIADLLAPVASQRQVMLTERGDIDSVVAHPSFRLFGCMNPSTDVGKRDLPGSIRSRFSEIYVHSPDGNVDDLCQIVDKYIGRYAVGDDWVVNDVAMLYLKAKEMAQQHLLVDGAGQTPHFSIRTLTRTLGYVGDIVSMYGLRRSLYEGFSMSFLTLLDIESEKKLEKEIFAATVGKMASAKSILNQVPRTPKDDNQYVQFKHYLLKQGPMEPQPQPHYIITPYVEHNLLNLVRATSGRRFPVLVQGPTSAGKTSMIQYLAAISGHKFVRINNHEHTDLQEYLGTYISDDTGKLTFQEGVLVEALRNGYWLVLDELNLAPTDVLEALNRLLDDNRELFIPETQEVIRPHPNFMLFATQNPPGAYGGRKQLSRAFRNRFLELHFDDIPQQELETILVQRCQIAPSYGKKIVEVYRQLSIERQRTRVFEKHSFATLRDLFRWALREAVGYEQLAANGYMLLAERVRVPAERQVVQQVLEKVMKVKLDMDAYYKQLENPEVLASSEVVWTKAMRRLAVLVEQSIKYHEPLLLVGETGCGKTTVCQVVAQVMGRQLVTVNAHQNTEVGDLLGAQRPVRNRHQTRAELQARLAELGFAGDDVDAQLAAYTQAQTSDAVVDSLTSRMATLFEWTDGPLVQALKQGEFFLLDEISLADDSVLERLNSVLEPERTLLLAEKGGSEASATVTGVAGFEFLATMNPGGDYGKKELSPALRNRFTEIWVPSMESFTDVADIVAAKLPNAELVKAIVGFSEWFALTYGHGNAQSGVISLRDILAWVEFIQANPKLEAAAALAHGAAMVFVDALGTNATAFLAERGLVEEKQRCVDQLSSQWGSSLDVYFSGKVTVTVSDTAVTAGDFSVPVVAEAATRDSFNLHAPTTATNAMRVVRAMSLPKPILLEGSPGVGKTSLVTALAKATGNNLCRINLSEHTDLVDLFGSDAPGERTGEFEWHDAPFLRAMQRGEWVLLDEMNLASQSVLEGLNACLDHRGQAYIPELDKTFARHPDFRVFAAQNPQYQGGGRKGLPKSFVNRFSVVYVDILSATDLSMISTHLYPQVPAETVDKMIAFVAELDRQSASWDGGPWEFNLRDTLRWLELYSHHASVSEDLAPGDFFGTIFGQRFRSLKDKERAQALFEDTVGSIPHRDNYYSISSQSVQVGSTLMRRAHHWTATKSVPLQCNFAVMESVLRGIAYNLPVIITGPSSSGKTEMIRFIGGVLGTPVVEFAMNADVDSMDILGGYEQVDVARKAAKIRTAISGEIRAYCHGEIAQGNANITSSLEFLALLDTSPELDQLLAALAVYKASRSTASLERHYTTLKSLESAANEVRFEWFDGMLVEAVERGHWLVLDNANLCNPSVLDRLNSLLEVNGSLIINECAHDDGSPRVIKPHPNFRLFLTVDPKYGELSRAMRNRGVEVYVEALIARATEFDASMLASGPDTEPVPALRFLDCSDSFLRPFLVADAAPTAGILPFSALRHMDAWNSSVASFGMFDAASVASVVAPLAKLSDDGVVDKFYEITVAAWRRVAEASGADNTNDATAIAEAVHPLINNAVVASVRAVAGATIDGPAPSVVFAVAQNLVDAGDIVTEIKSRSLTAKLSDLTPVEVSAAYEQGRQMKRAPRSPLFPWINAVYRAMVAYYQRLVAQIGVAPTDNGAATTDEAAPSSVALLHLQTIWFSLVDAGAHINEAKFAMYHQLIGDWVRAHPEAPEVKEALTQFPERHAHGRGSSMTRIWEAFRSSAYPQSAAGWQRAHALAEVCDEFDRVAAAQFTESADAVASLVSALASVYSAICDDDDGADAMLEQVKQGMAALAEVSKQFVIKREASCPELFAMIARFRAALGLDADPRLDVFAQWSSWQTVSSVEPFYTRLFASRSMESVRQLFDNQVVMGAINMALQYGNTPGYLLDQRRADCKELTRQLSVQSTAILGDVIDARGAALRQATLAVLKSFADTCDDAEAYLATIAAAEAEGDLGAIFTAVSASSDAHFIEVVHHYLAPALLAPNNWYTLGRASVMFGAAMLQLFVPQSPYDPAIREYVVFDVLAAQRRASSALIDEWRQVAQVISGAPTHIEATLADALAVPDAERPRVFRDAKRAIDPLIDEWNAFMESAVDTQPVAALLGAIDGEDVHAAAKVAMFEANSYQFLERVRGGQFAEYADLNDLLYLYVASIKFGVEVMQMSKTAQPALTNDFAIDAQQLLAAPPAASAVNATVKSLGADAVSADRVLVFLAQAALARPEREGLEYALQALYQRWSLRRLRDEEQAQSSWFKYTGIDENTDEDFRRLFPDYDEQMDLSDGTASNASVESVYTEWAQSYIAYFVNNESMAPKELVAAGAKLTLDQVAPQPVSPASLSAAQLCLKSALNLVDDDAANFYHGTNASEYAKSYAVIQRIFFAAKTHLAQWPEHASLQAIERTCWEYMNYSLAQHPVARCLAKVEQIYTYVAEWQKYASSQVSMAAHVDELTSLIVGWRQLELQSWPKLLDHELKVAQNQSMGKWWFHLYETVMGDSDIDELLAALTVFIGGAVYGEFASRLQLIKAFAAHLQATDGDDERIAALTNFVAFYTQFEAPVADAIAQSRTKLDKDMAEVVMLARWKDVNVDALKQSSRRSHLALYKVVRKFRALLASPVKPVIEAGAPTATTGALVSVAVPHFVEAQPGAATSIKSWSLRKPMLRDLSIVLGNVGVYSQAVLSQSVPSLYQWASELGEEMTKLRTETPKTLTDDNKKLVASLRSLKHKLLSDSLKQLRAMGLKLRVTKQPLTSAQLMQTEAFVGKLSGVDGYWFNILDLLPRLRFAASKCHEDVPQVEVDKAMAAGEDVIGYLTSWRRPLAKLERGISSLTSVVDELAAYASSDQQLPPASQIASLEANLKRIVATIPQWSAWADYAAEISPNPAFAKSLPSHSFIAATGESHQFVDKFSDQWQQIYTDVAQFASTSSDFGFVGSMVCSWMDTVKFGVESSTSLTELASESDVEQQFRLVSSAILVVIQRFSTHRFAGDDEQQPWFKHSQRVLKLQIASLAVDKVAGQLAACVRALKSVEYCEASSEAVMALIRFTMPLISAYAQVVSQVFTRARHNYVDVSHAGYNLLKSLHDIAANGFCSPAPPQDEEKTDPNLHDGTGLGDGAGAQTNNDDVDADDDDIADEAQRDNEEKDDGDNDDNDDAVSMDGDMAGDMEHGSDQDDDDEDADEDEELDEQIDDIDDLDPNAVDEKMWNDEAETEQKEKDTDTMPDQATNDDDMQANEDEDENQKPQKDDDRQAANDEDCDENDQKDGDEKEDGEDGDEEEEEEEDGVAEQEDDVRNQENEQMDDHVPESEVMDLPDDMNLDGDDEEDDGKDEEMRDDFDDGDSDHDDAKDEKADEDIDNGEGDEDDDAMDEDEAEGEENEDKPMDPETVEEEGEDGEEANSDPEQMEDPLESDVEEVERQDKQDEEGGNQAQDTEEAADGGDAEDEDVADEDMDAAAQQQSGQSGQGDDAEAQQEQDDVGGAGEAQAPQQDQDTDAQEDVARQQAQESIKQLGDALKEFHRRRQEINQASEETKPEQESANQRPDEFEHVDGANTNHDTQALGAADSKDQVQALDDNMAIDDDEPEQEPNAEQQPTEVKQEDEEMVKEDDEEVDADDAGDVDAPQDGAASSVVGERKPMDMAQDFDMANQLEMSDDEDEEAENDVIRPDNSIDREEPPRSAEEARELWTKADRATQDLASGLCEQLRLILEPTLATKLRGDYKTGKRLNMKRIIPYIASEFRKDKIWLRRTKPSKRQFQIMIAVDDSKSMSESATTELAFNSIALVAKALTQLESGGLSVVRFGEDVKVVHPFERQFNAVDTGARVFQWFDFQQTRTDITALARRSLKLFDDARASAANGELWQLQIILSDGVCEDHATVQRLVREAREHRVMMVFVVMDGINSQESILDMSQVSYVPDPVTGAMTLKVDKYLDTFPFEYYVVVKNIKELPEMLALILRQYFSEVAQT